MPFEDVIDIDTRADRGPAAMPLSVEEVGRASEACHVRADGGSQWVLHGVSVVPGPTGAPVWFAVSAQDITERRHAEEELRVLREHLAERVVRDPLTGLANRVLLEERLRSAPAREVGGRDSGAGRRDRGRGGGEHGAGGSGCRPGGGGRAAQSSRRQHVRRQAARPLSAHRPGSRHAVHQVDPCEPLAVASA